MQNKNLQNLLKKVNEETPVQQSEAELIILNEKSSNEIKGGCGNKTKVIVVIVAAPTVN